MEARCIRWVNRGGTEDSLDPSKAKLFKDDPLVHEILPSYVFILLLTYNNFASWTRIYWLSINGVLGLDKFHDFS